MALNTIISVAARNAMADALVDLLDVGGAGSLKIYTGTQPAGPGTAVGAQVLLGTLTLSNPAFGAASSGVVTQVATGTAEAEFVGSALTDPTRAGPTPMPRKGEHKCGDGSQAFWLPWQFSGGQSSPQRQQRTRAATCGTSAGRTLGGGWRSRKSVTTHSGRRGGFAQRTTDTRSLSLDSHPSRKETP